MTIYKSIIMKKVKTILIALIVLGLYIPNINAQDEEKEELWYCWEETVKPEKIDEYLELSIEFIELCKQNEFPFAFFTWSAKPFTYELWTPISSFSDIEKINDAWDKIVEKLGAKKHAAFQNTKICNRRFTCTIRNELSYNPKNPDYARNEFNYAKWIEVYIKDGKQKEFEEAVKWFNKERASNDYGSWVFYATGEFGYESPCYIVMIGNKNLLDFLQANKEINEKMNDEWKEYMNKIRPLMRKPSKNYDWYLLSGLSYKPVKE